MHREREVFGTYFYVLLPAGASDETAEAVHDLYAEAAADPEVSGILEAAGFGMEFVPYEDGPEVLAAQMESLVKVCEDLELAE